MSELLPLLPKAIHDPIKRTPYYAAKSDSLLLQSEESRKSQMNKDLCYEKLNDLVLEVYTKAVPGETSIEQKDKVQKLQKAENEARLRMKKKHSSKKAARGKGGRDD